jgi:hypothetical protein
VAAAVWAIIWVSTVATLNIIKCPLIRSLKLFHVTHTALLNARVVGRAGLLQINSIIGNIHVTAHNGLWLNNDRRLAKGLTARSHTSCAQSQSDGVLR